MTHWMHADEATLPEITAFLKTHPFALLPVGATEQHGPHLPLSTDTVLAEAFVREIAKRTGGLILPALPFGYSWTWRNIPGTMTLSFATYVDVIFDLAASLARTGVAAVAIVSGHDANRRPIKYAIRERIVDELGLPVLNLFYPALREILTEADSPQWEYGMLHADEFETSMMLHTRPEMVQMQHAVRDYPDAPSTFDMTAASMGDLMKSGVFGNATVATAEKGARWMARSANEAANLFRTFLRDLGLDPGAQDDQGASA